MGLPTRFKEIKLLLLTATLLIIGSATPTNHQARVVHCDDVIVGAGASGSYLASLAGDFPHARICIIEQGRAVKDLTLAAPVPWPYTAPDAVRLMSGMYLVTGNLLSQIREYETVPQAQLWTVLPPSDPTQPPLIIPGRKTITAYAEGGLGGGPNANAAGDRVPAKSVVDDEFDMPNFKWHEWKPDFDAMVPEIGISKVPLIPQFEPQLKLKAREGFISAGYYANPNMRQGNLLGSDGTEFCVKPTEANNPVLLNRTSSAFSFVEDYNGNTPYHNLHVFTNMRADRVHLKGWFNRARGVWATDVVTGERVYFKARNEVFLATGTRSDARILMSSGIYNCTVLRQWGVPCRIDNPNVGHNVWSHWNLRAIFSVNETMVAQPKIPDVEIGAAIFGYGPVTGVAPTASNRWGIGLSQLTAPILPGVETVGLLEMQAYDTKSRGSITFSNATSQAITFIDYRMLEDPRDVALVRDLVLEADRIVNQPAIKEAYPQRLLPEPFSIDTSDPTNIVVRGIELSDPFQAEIFARTSLGPAYHDGGSARMGRLTDRKRVVDTRARVVGTVGLRVVSSAVFPVPLRVNMAGPCMALGRRVKRLVVEERRSGRWRRGRSADNDGDDDEYSEPTQQSYMRLLELDNAETMPIPDDDFNEPMPVDE
jgi:choline dehydrogenase-like flavoprotein